MGHCDSSAQFSGPGGVGAAGSGTGARSDRGPEHGSHRHAENVKGMSVPARVLLFAVRVYQAFFSALMPSACKFYPSCSHYAAEAVRIHGARLWVWLAVWASSGL